MKNFLLKILGVKLCLKNSKSETSNSGYKGIYLNTSRKTPKYIAQIAFRNRSGEMEKYYVGCSETLEEAIKMREEFIKSLF